MMKVVTFMLSSISLLIQQYANNFEQEDLKLTLTQLRDDLGLPRIQTYDYIVVGGGSAGCVMAGRLSEKFNVLLLERGGSPVPVSYPPIFDDYTAASRFINDIFYSTPQRRSSLQTGGVFKLAGGRMLGGSSSHNDNIYNRGSPKDYDNYARLTQDPSWSYGNVLKYFKRMENYSGKLISETERNEYYGVGGPISVGTYIRRPSLLAQWLEAGQELGLKVADPNGYQTESITPMAYSTTESGLRASSYTSYIVPVENKRQTLTVMRYSKVEQVLVDENKTAYGVIYRRHGIPQIAHAKEVILSAGAISSPLLLIKSGIGSRKLLQKAKIPVVADVPGVGANLRDHSEVGLVFKLNPINGTNALADLLPQLNDANVEQELAKFHSGSGASVFTSFYAMGQAFIASSRAKREQESWPDIQIYITPRLLYNIENSEKGKGQNELTFGVVIDLNRQKSVGRLGFNVSAYLRNKRKDPQLAEMNQNFFSDSEGSDMKAMIEGIKFGLRIVEETKPFQNLGAEYVDSIPDLCKHRKFRSDAYWTCYVEQTSVSGFHIMGTAKMSLPTDPWGVVDSKLRVRGIKGLRVVDASIFPDTPNANPNAAVMMAAEKVVSELMNSEEKA